MFYFLWWGTSVFFYLAISCCHQQHRCYARFTRRKADPSCTVLDRIQGTLNIIMAGQEDDKLAKARVSAWKNLSDPGRTQAISPIQRIKA